MIKWSDGCSLAAISNFTSGKDPSVHFHNCLSSSELDAGMLESIPAITEGLGSPVYHRAIRPRLQPNYNHQSNTSFKGFLSRTLLHVLMFYLKVKENTRERIFWTIQPPCVRMYSKLIRSFYEGSWLDASQTSTSHFSPLSKYQSQLFQSGWDWSRYQIGASLHLQHRGTLVLF